MSRGPDETKHTDLACGPPIEDVCSRALGAFVTLPKALLISYDHGMLKDAIFLLLVFLAFFCINPL